MATKTSQEKPQTAHWWARDSQSLYVSNGHRKVRFSDYQVTLDLSDPVHKEVDEMLESHRSHKIDCFRVIDQKNTDAQAKQMMKVIRELLAPNTDGYADDVAKNSGILKVAALFSDEELEALDVRRHSPDVDLLTLKASQTKYIQGVE